MYDKFPDFDGHALIVSRHSSRLRFDAFIAIHSEVRGPAMGGCRIARYACGADAVADVPRLFRDISYKNAIANIPYGDAMAVIIADPTRADKRALVHEMGDLACSLEVRLTTLFDVGTTLDDVRAIGKRTTCVAGILPEAVNASGSSHQRSNWRLGGGRTSHRDACQENQAGSHARLRSLLRHQSHRQ